MPSPFPGMDPYLEDPAFWQDFHRSFMDDIRDAVLAQLPDAYDARMEESLRLIETLPPLSQKRFPDVAITRDPARSSSATAIATADVATVQGVEIAMRELEEVRDAWLEVRHRDERELVTVIEVLSPSNKTGTGWHDYDSKRRQLIQQRVNLVEIDLILNGRRIELRDPLPVGDYYGFVTQHRDWRISLKSTVYRWKVEDALPTLPVPLRPPDADIPLNLAPIFARTWERGRYARVLRYDRPLQGLDSVRAAWAAERATSLRAARAS